MPPNPFIILLYVIAAPTGVTLCVLGVKAIFFFAKASAQLDKIPEIADDVKTLRHGVVNDTHAVDLSLTIIQKDVNAIQEHVKLPITIYPERRLGPTDRRHDS
jgi:hypothetical protein